MLRGKVTNTNFSLSFDPTGVWAYGHNGHVVYCTPTLKENSQSESHIQ